MISAHTYEVVLKPTARGASLDLRGLWRYRDLLWRFVWRDFVSKYTQTILGPLWFIVQPLVMTAVLTVVFGRVIALSTDGLPPILFYLCGQIGWTYFSQTLTTNAATLVTNAAMFQKVYFPRLIVPLSVLISNLFAFVIQAALFFGFLLVYKYGIHAAPIAMDWHVVLLPLLVVHTALLSLGVGLLLSAWTAKYRDLTHATPLLLQVWMYATPVIYPLSRFPERWRWVAALNPMTAVMELYRYVLLGTGTVETGYVLSSVIATVGILAAGIVAFTRIERTFVDTI